MLSSLSARAFTTGTKGSSSVVVVVEGVVEAGGELAAGGAAAGEEAGGGGGGGGVLPSALPLPLPPSEQVATLSGNSALSKWQDVRSARGVTIKSLR